MQDTERSKCTTRGAQKYYIRRCVEEGPEKSAFVTGGALFCIKFIGRNAKHVVALDTNTMQDRAGNGGQFGRTLGLRRAGSGGSRVGRHGADSSMPGTGQPNARHPPAVLGHLFFVGFNAVCLRKAWSIEKATPRLLE